MALRIVYKLSLRSIHGNIPLRLDRSASNFKKKALYTEKGNSIKTDLQYNAVIYCCYNVLSITAILAYLNYCICNFHEHQEASVQYLVRVFHFRIHKNLFLGIEVKHTTLGQFNVVANTSLQKGSLKNRLQCVL